MSTTVAVFRIFPNGRDREPAYYAVDRGDDGRESLREIDWPQSMEIINTHEVTYTEPGYWSFYDEGFIVDERTNQYPANMAEAFGQL